MTAEMLSDRFASSDPAGRPLLPLANGGGDGGDHACGCGGEGACVCGQRAAAPAGLGRIVELPGRVSFSFDDSSFAAPKTAAAVADATAGVQAQGAPTASAQARASKITGLPGGAPVTVEYGVEGMTCGHCVAAVRQEVRALDRVLDVDVVLRKGGRSTVIVTSAGELERADVEAAVDEAGYALLP